MPTPGVEIEGLADFRRDLKALDAALPKALRQGLKKVADEIAADTRSSFGGRGGVAPKVAASVKALAQQSGAAIQLGGASWPYALGAEFGGQRRETTKQFQPWRGNGASAGYSLYPSIRKGRERMVVELDALFASLAKQAFPE